MLVLGEIKSCVPKCCIQSINLILSIKAVKILFKPFFVLLVEKTVFVYSRSWIRHDLIRKFSREYIR